MKILKRDNLGHIVKGNGELPNNGKTAHNCLICKQSFFAFKGSNRKYCGRKCTTIAWIEKVVRPTHSNPIVQAKIQAAKIGKKRPELSGDKHFAYKGKGASYSSLHNWVKRQAGTPKKCEHCGLNDLNRKYEWANKSNNYERDLSDWIRLCVPCHRKFDMGRVGMKKEWTLIGKQWHRAYNAP